MTISDKVEARIKQSERSVYMRSDFSDLGSYSQVGKAIRLMCLKEILIRIGYGLYAKARRNSINNKLMFAADGQDAVLMEALDRLKIPYEIHGLTASYIKGSATQVPAFIDIRIKKRFSRKLVIKNIKIN